MMSFLKTLQKFERIIIGDKKTDKKTDKKPKDHWKKYIKPKSQDSN